MRRLARVQVMNSGIGELNPWLEEFRSNDGTKVIQCFGVPIAIWAGGSGETVERSAHRLRVLACCDEGALNEEEDLPWARTMY
jgi:hypothetical protein